VTRAIYVGPWRVDLTVRDGVTLPASGAALARAIGADDRLDPDLVDFAAAYLGPQVDAWRAAGAFGPRIEPAAGADVQSRLLALTGRQPA